MVNEIFTEEIESVKANNEGTLEGFKEKSDWEKQESDEQPDYRYAWIRVKNLLSKIKSKEEWDQKY